MSYYAVRHGRNPGIYYTWYGKDLFVQDIKKTRFLVVKF